MVLEEARNGGIVLRVRLIIATSSFLVAFPAAGQVFTKSEQAALWKSRSTPIYEFATQIEIAKRCGVVDNFTAQVALTKIEAQAFHLATGGLNILIYGDQLETELKSAVTKGDVIATTTLCRHVKTNPEATSEIKQAIQELLESSSD